MTQTPHPTLAEMVSSRASLAQLVVQTPVLACQSADFRKAVGLETQAFLKLELFQHGGSFKVRGALRNMLALDPETLSRGVIAVSAGNHAIAVSYAAQVVGTHAKLVMPKTAPQLRVKRCRDLGAEVILTEDVFAAFDLASQLEVSEGRRMVHPFEGLEVALGTSGVALELLDQVADLDAVIVPIGGGGLAAGVACAIKLARPECQVFGVEPIGADSMSRSFEAGKPMRIEKVQTIADSLGAPFAAPFSFALCKQFIDRIVTVDDDQLCKAMALLFHEAKLASEPASAASTAALCGPLREELRGKRVGLIVSGSNLDPQTFGTHLQRGNAL